MGQTIVQRHGGNWLWLAHRRELVTQTQERVTEATVSTIQLLVSNGQRPHADGIIWDECHRAVTDEWAKLLDAYPGVPLVGLTATPQRSDGKPLSPPFTELVVAAHYSELIDQGHLVQCRIFAPEGDHSDGLASNPVDAYLKYASGKQGFFFVTGQKNAMKWAAEFTARGIPSAAIVSSTPDGVRRTTLDAFRYGEILMLTTHDVLTEGIDVPEAECCIVGRRFQHVLSYLQAAGRVLRPCSGKQRAILIDLTGAYKRHGPPTLDREYSLDGKPIRAGVGAPLKTCLGCGAVIFAAAQRCPECGEVFPVRTVQIKIYNRELAMVYDGENTPTAAKRGEWERLRGLCYAKDWGLSWAVKQFASLFGAKPSNDWFSQDDKRREFQKLSAFAQSKGYKSGFVAHRYRDTFGVWPRNVRAQNDNEQRAAI